MTLPNLDKTVTKDPAPPGTDTVLTPIFAPSDGTVALTTLVLNKSIDNINEIIDYISGENASGKIPVGTAVTGTTAQFDTACTDGNFIFVGDAISISTITGTQAQFDTACTDGDFIYVGDSISISTITGTRAQFDTACTDADFIYVGDSTEVFTWTANHNANSNDLINVNLITLTGGDVATGGDIRFDADSVLGFGTTNPTSLNITSAGAVKLMSFGWDGGTLSVDDTVGGLFYGLFANVFSEIITITGLGEDVRFYGQPNGGTNGDTATIFMSEIDVADDTSTRAVTEFVSRRVDETVITTRPLFEFFNNTTSIVTIDTNLFTVLGLDLSLSSNNFIRWGASNNRRINNTSGGFTYEVETDDQHAFEFQSVIGFLLDQNTEVNVVCGLQSVLANDATDGFLYIPTTDTGAPTATPTVYTGKAAMVFDPANKELYVYNTDAAAWESVTLA